MSIKRRIERLEVINAPDFSKMRDEELENWGRANCSEEEWERISAEVQAMSAEELEAIING